MYKCIYCQTSGCNHLRFQSQKFEVVLFVTSCKQPLDRQQSRNQIVGCYNIKHERTGKEYGCFLFVSKTKGRRTLADFLLADKKSSLVGQCAVNSDKSATKSGLIGRYLTVLDLKTSCWALSASVRWTKTICRGSRVPQPMRNCHENHVNKRFSNMAEIDSAPSLNVVSRDKKSARVRQADVPTNFIPIYIITPSKNLQFYDKNRLVCGSLQLPTQFNFTNHSQTSLQLPLSRKIKLTVMKTGLLQGCNVTSVFPGGIFQNLKTKMLTLAQKQLTQ